MSEQSLQVLVSGVMAATERVVNQALVGAWEEVPRTLEQRRELVDQLRTRSVSADTPWLKALQQAVIESDAAVKTISEAAASRHYDDPAENLHIALRQSLISGR